MISFTAHPVKGMYYVEIDGQARGWVEKTHDGLWQAWVFRTSPRPNMKIGVPYTTRREAGDEVDIQWEQWN